MHAAKKLQQERNIAFYEHGETARKGLAHGLRPKNQWRRLLALRRVALQQRTAQLARLASVGGMQSSRLAASDSGEPTSVIPHVSMFAHVHVRRSGFEESYALYGCSTCGDLPFDLICRSPWHCRAVSTCGARFGQQVGTCGAPREGFLDTQ